MKNVVNTLILIMSFFIYGCDKDGDGNMFGGSSKVIEVTTTMNAPNVEWNGVFTTSSSIVENIFGLHTWGEHHTRPEVLNAIDDIGVEWIYNGIHWPTVEPTKDNYKIDVYDPFMTEMATRNIQVVMSLGNYWPAWINDSESLKSEVYQMTKKVVERYKPNGVFANTNGFGDYGIRYWEIINEPNYPCCGWGAHDANQPVHTALYAELLEVMHKAIREVDPSAVIILGGLSSSTEFKPPLDFLDDMYSYGAKDAFDIIAYHPYGEHDDIMTPLNAITAKMNSFGDNKPIWILEIGEPNLDENHPYKDSQIEVFNKLAAQDENMKAFFWLSLMDFSQTETWGILDHNFNKRQPIYDRLKEYVN